MTTRQSLMAEMYNLMLKTLEKLKYLYLLAQNFNLCLTLSMQGTFEHLLPHMANSGHIRNEIHSLSLKTAWYMCHHLVKLWSCK